MKRQSSHSWDQDQLKNTKPRESWDHTSPIGNDNSSNNNNQPPRTSTSDASISEHHPVPSTSQSFVTYGTSECYNQIDRNQGMMQNQIPATSSCDRNIESMSSDNINTRNFKYPSQIQQTESFNTEGTACLPSPFAFQYSDKEAASLMVKLCNKDTFRPALQVLISWLKNNEVTESNSTYLFSLINCAQSSVWRVKNEIAKLKEELNNVNLDVSQKKDNISSQLREISKVFEKAKMEKVWDQFTGPQRKMISSWMEEIEQMSVLRKESVAENSDPNEDYFEKSKNSNLLTDSVVNEHQKCKEELDSLNKQLKAIEDNIAVLHNEKEIKIKFYEDTFLGMDQKYEKMQAEMEENKSLLGVESLNKNENEIKSISSKDSQHRQVPKSLEEERLKTKQEISADEVHHVTLISSFLQIHHDGANVDDISSCLEKFNPELNDCLYIENLMFRFPHLFREKSRGEGANLTKKWVCYMFGKDSP